MSPVHLRRLSADAEQLLQSLHSGPADPPVFGGGGGGNGRSWVVQANGVVQGDQGDDEEGAQRNEVRFRKDCLLAKPDCEGCVVMCLLTRRMDCHVFVNKKDIWSRVC